MIISESEKNEFLALVNDRYGYDFSGYADASIKRRIIRFAQHNKFETYFNLRHHVLNEQHVFEKFVIEVTVNVTEMFRDPSFFGSIRKHIFPLLDTYPHLKIWHAGCSTGEEVYSLAILLQEHGLYKNSIIYGTDINSEVLQIAKDGVYPLKLMKDYHAAYLKSGGKASLADYYQVKQDQVIMNKALKKNLVFSTHNLTGDTSFNEFQLIVCRNVMIYFKRELQEKVFELFYNSLAMFGFIALGSKETLQFSELRDKFEVIDKNEKLYRKIA